MYHQIVKNKDPSSCLLIQRSFTSERAAADAPPDRKECRPKLKVGSTDLSLSMLYRVHLAWSHNVSCRVAYIFVFKNKFDCTL